MDARLSAVPDRVKIKCTQALKLSSGGRHALAAAASRSFLGWPHSLHFIWCLPASDAALWMCTYVDRIGKPHQAPLLLLLAIMPPKDHRIYWLRHQAAGGIQKYNSVATARSKARIWLQRNMQQFMLYRDHLFNLSLFLCLTISWHTYYRRETMRRVFAALWRFILPHRNRPAERLFFYYLICCC